MAGASKNFEAAAGMGHPQAEFELGQAYMDGNGVKKDIKKAKDWFGKAAAKGMPEAKIALDALNAAGK